MKSDQPGTERGLVLETKGLSKYFGTLKANEKIDLQVYSGEVHAILGENGAGKSTLMKMLYGYYHPTSGEIQVGGRSVEITHPRIGRNLGIGMVFQSFTLIPAMKVWENVALFLDGASANRNHVVSGLKEIGERYGLVLHPDSYIRDLGMGERQRVEIAKIILSGSKILIFDEPTSVLTPQEAQALFRVFDQLRSENYAILFITHKLPEVLQTADRITVLRKGQIADTLSAQGVSRDQLVELLIGEKDPGWKEFSRRKDQKIGDVLLSFQGVGTLPPQVDEQESATHGELFDMNFDVRVGEIFGIAAVSGNGQEILGDLILGLRKPGRGTIRYEGTGTSPENPETAISSGISILPEDPLLEGSVGNLTVRENLILGRQRDYANLQGWSLNKEKIESDCDGWLMQAFVQSPPNKDVPAGSLSGGNLQRVLIARELASSPRLFVSYYLSRGLDLSNARAARDLMMKLAGEGMAVIFIGEDLEELLALSDRIMVLRDGKSQGIFEASETDALSLGALMIGSQELEAIQ